MRHTLRLPLASTLFLLAVSLSLHSQPQKIEIRGVVLDPDTNQPVVAADVTLAVQGPGPVRVNGGFEDVGSSKITTSATGTFAVSPEKLGTYRLQARKPGYGALSNGPPDYTEVKLTADNPRAEVKLYLVRLGMLSGRAIDAETGKPMANLRLNALRAGQRGARSSPIRSVAGKTGADGQFQIPDLPPGDYVVEVVPKANQEQRVLTTFSESDLEKTDLDLEHAYWPGGLGEEGALPVTLASGGAVDVGKISVRTVPYYRLHVRIPASNCQPGDTMLVAEIIGTLHTPALKQVPCGKDILVTGYSRGTYRLILAIVGRSREDGGTASIPFAIADKNVAISAPILPPVTVDGVIVTAEGSKPPDFAKLSVGLRSVDGLGSPQVEIQAPESDGKFQISYVRPLSHNLLVTGLGTTHYVKEIRYNGGALPDGIVPLDVPSMTHNLTILIDDKVATLTGSVSNSDGPMRNARVIAMKWPWDPAFLGSGVALAQADATGHFQMTGLAPGEYRIAAVASITQEMMNLSNPELERAMASGKKVELSPRGFQSITLEPSGFRRQ